MRSWSIKRTLVLLIGANIVLAGSLFAVKPPGAVAVSSGPPPAMPQAFAELDARVKAKASGETYSLTLTDKELTELAAYALSFAPDISFDRVAVTVQPGRLTIDGVTNGLALTAPVRVNATLAALNGEAIIRVEDISLGDVALPPFVRDQIRSQVNSALAPDRLKLPFTVDELEQSAGSLTLRGTIR